MSRTTVYTYVGATGMPLEWALKDDDGNPIDVSSADITLELYAIHGGVRKIDGGTITKDVAASGEVSYTPTASEIDVAGTYQAQIKLTDSSGEDDLVRYFGWMDIVVQDTAETLVPSE